MTNEILNPPDTQSDKPIVKKIRFRDAWSLWMADVRRKRVGFASRPQDKTFFKQYIKINLELGSMAVMIFRYGQWATRIKNPIFKLIFAAPYAIMNMGTMVTAGINIQPGSTIGGGFIIHNFSCIFIWSDCIGENCTVNQGVTIGNIRGSGGLPQIGNNVYIASGAKVLGNVKIGNNVVVAANSVVMTDVPDNATVMGVPARVISRNATSEYLKF
jgi:serine O-acetyltransferase